MNYLVMGSFFFYCFFIKQSKQDGIEDFIRSSRILTAELYQSIAVKYSDNFIFSPFSVQTILALVNEGAQGETRTELINGLFLPDSTVEIQNALKIILQNVDSNNGVDLKSTNTIFANIGVTPNSNFQQIASEVYRAEFQNLNFADSVESANIINKWVDDQTNHKISRLVSASDIATDVSMLLVNAIYFNAAWEHQFSETSSRTFYNYGKDPIQIPVMGTSNSYNYYTDDELDVSFIELPYKGVNLSMVIILPTNNDGLKSIETNVRALYETPNWSEMSLDITLPRFEVESTFHFANILKNLGITKLFNNEAELDNLAGIRLHITDIVQKAFINVTETGTEAAAVTIAIENKFAREEINVDHPFMYYIQKNGVILFAGRVNCFEN